MSYGFNISLEALTRGFLFFYYFFWGVHFPIWHFGGAGVLQKEQPQAEPCHRYSSLPPSLNPHLDPRICMQNPAICFTYGRRLRAAACLCKLPAWGMRRHLKAAAAAAGLIRVLSIIQVLHLMNKMNLPCPFGPVTARPPMVSPRTRAAEIKLLVWATGRRSFTKLGWETLAKVCLKWEKVHRPLEESQKSIKT